MLNSVKNLSRAFYADSIPAFLKSSEEEIIGKLAIGNPFTLEQSQRSAWIEQIRILREILTLYTGSIFFEYSIPRMGQRIDVVLLIESVIFVLEFKVGEVEFFSHAYDQVFDYALDLKNFHEPSHDQFIAPILIATEAEVAQPVIATTPQKDKLLFPITTTVDLLGKVIKDVLSFSSGSKIEQALWANGRYCPTPTIIEAAMALYNKHSVEEIARNDAEATNLRETSNIISEIIEVSKQNSQKSICFVTGVPGAGKTLVGLNIATTHFDKANELYSVFLSGNGPLVAILREALARDQVKRKKMKGQPVKKGEAMSTVKTFIQNVHHFRDDCLADLKQPPTEHVVLFDEAQRAWNREQTSSFMRRKKGLAGFDQSEPEFLISCLDRHQDWAVVVCLVGGGQEINIGEAGIDAWIEALIKLYPDWNIYISPQLTDSEYSSSKSLQALEDRKCVTYKKELHLAVSMRSFRAEHVSHMVKQLLDLEISAAREALRQVAPKYPMVITRDIKGAKTWLKKQARGSERYGIVVSSQAERLKPHAIDVKSPINPIHWFLDGKEDVRSSYYLEDAATEFHVQGLELDWACVVWDADFRYSKRGWEHRSFRGGKWNHIKKEERKKYLKNAYRVLLTRARQGMVIVVPKGDPEDPTRDSKFYDPTFEYLKEIGFEII